MRLKQYEDAPPRSGTQAPSRGVRVFPLVSLFVWAVAIGLCLYFLSAFKLVVLAFLAAASLAAAMAPLKRHIPGPRGLAGSLAGLIPLLLSLAALAGLAWAIYSPFQQQMGQWPQIRTRINDLLARWSGRLPLDEPLTIQSVTAELLNIFQGGRMLEATASAITTVAVALVVIFFGTIYLLTVRRSTMMRPLLRALPDRHREPFARSISELEPRLRWWVIGTLISMALVGVASWGAYAAVGLSMALPLALLAGVAEVVPTVGPIIAVSVALVFAATQGTTQVVGVLVAYLIIQTLESYVILPLVMKRAVRIPPVVTLFTVVLWAMVLGPAGLLLAIPIDLVLWTFADNYLLRRRGPPDEALVHGG